MKELKKYCVFILILSIVTFSWIGLEYVLDGKVISQHSDGIVAIILSYLLYDRIYYKYID